MLKDKDDLSWYARKAAGLRGGTDAPAPGPSEKAAGLLRELASAGIKGSIEERTLYTRRLPPGCRGCLGGKGERASSANFSLLFSNFEQLF